MEPQKKNSQSLNEELQNYSQKVERDTPQMQGPTTHHKSEIQIQNNWQLESATSLS